MDFAEKQELLLKFLNKNYVIKEAKFFRTYDDVHEWGNSISNALSKIFSFDEEYCVMQLKYWSEINGLDESDWLTATGPRKLKAVWTPELAQDLEALCGFNAEQELISVLASEIAKEINSEILNELRGQIKTQDEFLGVMKCVGYETTPQLVNPNTFKPYKGFVSMNHNDIKNERKTNTFWKDWIRTRKQDKKTR